MNIEPGYIGILATVMKERGHDPALIGARYVTALNEGQLLDLCTRIVAATRGDPALALHVGAAMHIGVHGLFGHALMSCRSLKQAAGILMRHNPLMSERAHSELTFDKGMAILGFEPPFKVPGMPDFLTDVFFAAAVTAIRELIGRDTVDVHLELSYKPNADPSEYEAVLHMPVRFECGANQLKGPAPLLDLPLQSAGVATADAYLRQCELLLRKMQTARGHESSVRRILLSSRGRYPSAPEIARTLNMSERTLRRRLEAEGTSYQAIVDSVRNHLAQQYLMDTDLSVVEIGSLVGFDDLANFRQAFRRWNSMSPAQFRVLHLARRTGRGREASAPAQLRQATSRRRS